MTEGFAVVNKKTQRPSAFSPEIADVICKRLAGGENLRAFWQMAKLSD